MHNHYHFIGIGGIGMSGIAQLLLRSNRQVSGSDLKESKITQELKSLGANISIGHSGANITDADVVVYSSAVKDDNPEVREARARGIPLIKRAEALAQLMQDKSVITVTGSHGKTTTSSLASYLLMEAGFCPTAVIGGILRNIDNNACLGNGKFFVAEADESDGSFLHYRPTYSIITNIDREHLDYYSTFEREVEAFEEFIHKTAKDGCVFWCRDDATLQRLMHAYPQKNVSFGLTQGADIRAEAIAMEGLSSRFDCFSKDKKVGSFTLSLGGLHNVSNALAVIGLGLELGIDIGFIKKTLNGYQGSKRRLEIKYNANQILLIDDYAHHPTEIQATLAAAKNLKAKRMVAVFQPHRYTRTQLLLDEFSKSFDAADYLVITDIYAASELAIEGVNAKFLVDRIKQRLPDKEVIYLPKEEIIRHILKIVRPKDLVLTIGAGDIVKIGDELAEELKRKS